MNPETLKQMGRDCMAVITKKIKQEMTSEEYYIELMELHKKYPMNGEDNFYQAAQKYIKQCQKPTDLPSWLILKPPKKERKIRLPYKDDQ